MIQFAQQIHSFSQRKVDIHEFLREDANVKAKTATPEENNPPAAGKQYPPPSLSTGASNAKRYNEIESRWNYRKILKGHSPRPSPQQSSFATTGGPPALIEPKSEPNVKLKKIVRSVSENNLKSKKKTKPSISDPMPLVLPDSLATTPLMTTLKAQTESDHPQPQQEKAVVPSLQSSDRPAARSSATLGKLRASTHNVTAERQVGWTLRQRRLRLCMENYASLNHQDATQQQDVQQESAPTPDSMLIPEDLFLSDAQLYSILQRRDGRFASTCQSPLQSLWTDDMKMHNVTPTESPDLITPTNLEEAREYCFHVDNRQNDRSSHSRQPSKTLQESINKHVVDNNTTIRKAHAALFKQLRSLDAMALAPKSEIEVDDELGDMYDSHADDEYEEADAELEAYEMHHGSMPFKKLSRYLSHFSTPSMSSLAHSSATNDGDERDIGGERAQPAQTYSCASNDAMACGTSFEMVPVRRSSLTSSPASHLLHIPDRDSHGSVQVSIKEVEVEETETDQESRKLIKSRQFDGYTFPMPKHPSAQPRPASLLFQSLQADSRPPTPPLPSVRVRSSTMKHESGAGPESELSSTIAKWQRRTSSLQQSHLPVPHQEHQAQAENVSNEDEREDSHLEVDNAIRPSPRSDGPSMFSSFMQQQQYLPQDESDDLDELSNELQTATLHFHVPRFDFDAEDVQYGKRHTFAVVKSAFSMLIDRRSKQQQRDTLVTDSTDYTKTDRFTLDDLNSSEDSNGASKDSSATANGANADSYFDVVLPTQAVSEVRKSKISLFPGGRLRRRKSSVNMSVSEA